MDHVSLEIALCRDRLRLLEAFSSLPSAVREMPVTRSEHDAEQWWSPNDHFSHLVRLERYFVSLIARYLAGEVVVATPPISDENLLAGETPLATVHRVNEEFAIAHRRDFAELIMMSQESHAELLALLARTVPGSLGAVIPGAPWGDGTVAALMLHNTGDHFERHWKWITDGLAQRT